MSKFGWANFDSLSPPPDALTSVLVSEEFQSKQNKTAKTRRRLADAAVAAGAEEEEEEDPPSDLPDPNESGNQAMLRKSGGVSADEFFIGTILVSQRFL
jgi:hypothetical protein